MRKLWILALALAMVVAGGKLASGGGNGNIRGEQVKLVPDSGGVKNIKQAPDRGEVGGGNGNIRGEQVKLVSESVKASLPSSKREKGSPDRGEGLVVGRIVAPRSENRPPENVQPEDPPENHLPIVNSEPTVPETPEIPPGMEIRDGYWVSTVKPTLCSVQTKLTGLENLHTVEITASKLENLQSVTKR